MSDIKNKNGFAGGLTRRDALKAIGTAAALGIGGFTLRGAVVCPDGERNGPIYCSSLPMITGPTAWARWVTPS